MVASKCVIFRAGERLSHAEASRLALVAEASGAQSIILDMSRVLEATTPALARLILLRRELLQRGCDLRLAALRGQPAKLLEVHRLDSVLPRISDLPAEPRQPQAPRSTRKSTSRLIDAEIAGSYCVLR